jgi:hypothetical protein
MATIADYLEIADAAYHADPENRISARWQVRKWEKATWYGNGFQGGVFEDDSELIVAFSGTKGGPTSAPISQNSANARIGVLVIPNMAGAAKKLVDWAEQNRGEKPVSIVGHSLGGALAQAIGAWSGHPFISLNGPGMAAHLKVSAFNVFKPRQMARSIKARKEGTPVGLCLNVKGDFVGAYGHGHIGDVVELTPAPGQPTHDLDTISRNLSDDDLRGPPWALATHWPIPHISDDTPRIEAIRDVGPNFTKLIGRERAFKGVKMPAISDSKPVKADYLEQRYNQLIPQTEVLTQKWVALGAWLTSVAGIPSGSLESRIGATRSRHEATSGPDNAV